MFKLAIFVLVALGFSFLCSIAEAVLLSVTPSYVALLEQKGKGSGKLYWRTLAPPVARGVMIMIWLMYPLVWLSEKLTKLLSKRDAADIFCREEFTAMVRLGVQEGQIDERESHIVKNLFRFPKLRVKDIMTPRTVVFALRESMTVDQVFAESPEIAFSRIPIFKDNHDNVNGFVLKSDILLAQARDQHEARLYEFNREIRSIPEMASLSNLFEFLLEIVDETDKTTDMRALARAQWKNRARQFGLLKDEPRPESRQNGTGSCEEL